MTRNAQRIIDNLAATTGPLKGNTVEDVATQTGLDQGQMEAALDELSAAGLIRQGDLWASIGDYRDIVALGTPRYCRTAE